MAWVIFKRAGVTFFEFLVMVPGPYEPKPHLLLLCVYLHSMGGCSSGEGVLGGKGFAITDTEI